MRFVHWCHDRGFERFQEGFQRGTMRVLDIVALFVRGFDATEVRGDGDGFDGPP